MVIYVYVCIRVWEDSRLDRYFSTKTPIEPVPGSQIVIETRRRVRSPFSSTNDLKAVWFRSIRSCTHAYMTAFCMLARMQPRVRTRGLHTRVCTIVPTCPRADPGAHIRMRIRYAILRDKSARVTHAYRYACVSGSSPRQAFSSAGMHVVAPELRT